MRQLCNVAFMAQVEYLDSKEYKEFVADLEAHPERPVSHGVADLMAVFGMAGGG